MPGTWYLAPFIAPSSGTATQSVDDGQLIVDSELLPTLRAGRWGAPAAGSWDPNSGPPLPAAKQSKADMHDSAYSPISETRALVQLTILSRGFHETSGQGGQQGSTVALRHGKGEATNRGRNIERMPLVGG